MEIMDHCRSCAAPLGMPEFKGPCEHYCQFCTADDGSIKPRQAVQKGIADWFKSWQPDIDDALALERAAHYMKSMPHWAQSADK